MKVKNFFSKWRIFPLKEKYLHEKENMSQRGECFSLIENICSHKKIFPMNKNKMPQVDNVFLLKYKFFPNKEIFSMNENKISQHEECSLIE
jgi:hypothetical protein